MQTTPLPSTEGMDAQVRDEVSKAMLGIVSIGLNPELETRIAETISAWAHDANSQKKKEQDRGLLHEMPGPSLEDPQAPPGPNEDG